MRYILKMFNYSLLSFTYVDDGIKGQYCEINEINEENKHLFPIGLDVSNKGLMSWLKRRVIPKHREFVDALLAKTGSSQSDTISIINTCKGLSFIDSYWIVEYGFEGEFEDFNLFENKFEKALSLIAYTGYGSVNAKGFSSSPEFTTNGMLRKGWRNLQGHTYLYKGGTSGGINTGFEPYSEFYASQIAERMGLNHVSYDLSKWKGEVCSKCELFTDINTSYVQIFDFVKDKSIYEVGEYLKSLNEQFYNDFVDMLIFDSLICNQDRHYGNFGLLVDNQINKPISFAPIFDNGLSLFHAAMPNYFDDLEAYSKTRTSYYNVPFIDLARSFISDKQRLQLRKMINFKFKLHPSYNLPSKRIKAIEGFLQKRVIQLLDLDNNSII